MVTIDYTATCLQLVPIITVVLGTFRGIVHIYQMQPKPLDVTQFIRPSL